jgi:prevent-host-death family protein
MTVSVTEAGGMLSQLIHAVENGQEVLLTDEGKPVALLAPPPVAPARRARFDGMRDRIKLPPGWDDPIDLDAFLEGKL